MDWHWYKVTLQFRYVQVSIKPIVTIYRIAFAPAQKPYWRGLLFTHENRDFGVFSVMKRSCAARISKVYSHNSIGSGIHYTGLLIVSAQKAIPYNVNIALIVEILRLKRLLSVTLTNEQLRLPQEKEWRPIWGDYTGRFATTIFGATKRCNVTTMFQLFQTMSKQCCNILLS